MGDPRSVAAGERGADVARDGASPIKVFLALAALVATVVAAVLLTREDEDAPARSVGGTTAASPTAPDATLTNAEALATFDDLLSMRDRAFRQRDLELVSSIYTADSPVRSIAINEVQRLRRDGVLDRSRYETADLKVLSIETERVRIRQHVEVSPRFMTESGRNVTRQDKDVRQIVVWTLRFDGSRWLIHNSVITSSEILNG